MATSQELTADIQALATSFPKRLANDSDNSLLINVAPTGRQAKRHIQQINYSEEFGDDLDFDEFPSSTPGTRSLNENKAQIEAQRYSLAKNTPTPKRILEKPVLSELVEKPVVLIPIKIMIENLNTNQKLIDSFMWNLNESLITPTEFAEIVCSDLDLPFSMAAQIADSINQQIEEYSYASNLQLPNKGPYNVTIDLSVNLNKQLYQDRFEWDMNQNEVTPEIFAEIVVADLGLSLEFKNAISHALHEIIIRVKKEVIDGIRIFTENSVQNGNDRWEPLVEVLTSSEIERRENERVRNLRRLKRENMRRDYDDHSRRRQAGKRRYDELEGAWV
ncbi:SNF5 / SMARCB1 / INI1 family protein [Candida albicans]|uniref:SNF5 / SMARCB1 / INI1 family protein n=1 Tax=Candida albicans TaxID=5476 RepID=A0A8H6BRD9_CANAX|nr:SNF5 / SMARCB1 / INI1 family protein [Candida albicans]